MDVSVFVYRDYKKYLNERLDDLRRGGGRGSRARLAEALGCQTAYIAQVLRGVAHFSLEHAEAVNSFCGHTDSESEYFIALVQHERSGSTALRKRLAQQLEKLRQQSQVLKTRLQVGQPMSEAHQAIYYSSWVYGAVHALVSVPGFQTADAISRRLSIGVAHAQNVIEFLLSCGLLVYEKKSLKIGTARIHLGNDSVLLNKHHINWRLRAMQDFDKSGAGTSLHYSSIVSLSKDDAERIHELLIQAIQKSKTIVRDSPEEELRSLCVDFFEP